MTKEKLLTKKRRYYFDFKCVKCGFPNIGNTESDNKAGLSLIDYGIDCCNCAHLNAVDLEVKYYKIVEIQISKEDWEK